ncbi:hypothetical protein AB0873_12885 [Micromonospora sp. NPDC047707]|uniref:hypothetical protein n=1 Tax=Micromonospora sp. NPDC047707 TaxID=3154498 RepID=UPI0034568529
MKIYADRFPTAARQLLTDLLVVAWVYASVRGALWLHDLVQKLAVPGQKLEGAGGGLADNLAEAGGKVGRLPLVGDELTAPFERAAGAARSLAEAGRDQQELVDQLALALAVAVLVFPLGLVLLGWLPLRVRWMRRAGAAAKLAAAPPAGTCSPCGPWPPSRWASWPASPPTWPRRGGAATTTRSRRWPPWSCAPWAYAAAESRRARPHADRTSTWRLSAAVCCPSMTRTAPARPCGPPARAARLRARRPTPAGGR